MTQLLKDAVMIASPESDDPAVVLGTTFALDPSHGAVVRGSLAATAHGVYEVRLNGRPASPAVLAPGWTSYEWHLPVATIDVTSLLEPANDVCVELGNGWWRGRLGWEGADLGYGDELGFVATLTIEYADGYVQQVHTDTAWTAVDSRTTENSLYGGQHVDLRRTPGAPRPVRAVEFDRSTLIAQVGPDVVRHEVVPPQRIWQSPSGRTLVDFGVNLVGWIRFTAPADPGRVITLRHAEVLEAGELGTRPLRSAKATDVITCSDVATVVEPSLTFHGFRYAEVTGWPGALNAADLQAVVVHSAMRRTGGFECSEPLLNQFHANVVRSQRGNFLHIPTDCPQRDERLGWTGDIAAFAPTATFVYDCADLLHSWLLDLQAETAHRGTVPMVVPDILKFSDAPHNDRGATAVWGDAAVWVPWALWQAYGDRERLAEHYPAMVLHLDSVAAVTSPNGLWDTGFQYGDWLDPDAPPEAPAQAKADPGVVATACLYRSAMITAEVAGLLGRADDQERFAAVAATTRRAFHDHYVTGDGRIHSDCTTVYALAICFGLLDEAGTAAAGERLAELVTASGHRISTGFAGTPFVTWALSETGHVADAYALLLQTDCPSWLYPVKMGATTIWERWDSMLPDGSINPGSMTSFNHYALGAVADWLHQAVAGIRAAEPGYARVRIAPVPGPGLTWARADLDSRRGRISSAWQLTDDEFRVTVEIPADTPGEIVLPSGTVHEVVGGRHEFTQPAPVFS
ncbi:family 78 glycoside hydrolase catalytic domain [Microlunatus sp. Y2014]|uniref:alpha-L-rhamnosidase n=1 Tax=Microlunatus sp. Y2014 TaxID=3418488 RepID=UPI003DA78948